jgi:hypothetical protein
MIRSRLVQAWLARFKQREDPTLERFGNLRIDPAATRVPLFYARKAA